MRKRLSVVTQAVGWDEALLLLGLILLTAGLWPVLHRGALSAPGVVLLWIALPSRTRFVERVEPTPAQKRSRA